MHQFSEHDWLRDLVINSKQFFGYNFLGSHFEPAPSDLTWNQRQNIRWSLSFKVKDQYRRIQL